VLLPRWMPEHPAEPQPLRVASCTADGRCHCSWQKHRQATQGSVTDRPAKCGALTPFIQCCSLRHRAVVGKERETEGGVNSPQRNVRSAGKGRSICLRAQSVTHANTNLLGQQAHTGRVPVHPSNAHKHRHTHPNRAETVITLV